MAHLGKVEPAASLPGRVPACLPQAREALQRRDERLSALQQVRRVGEEGSPDPCAHTSSVLAACDCGHPARRCRKARHALCSACHAPTKQDLQQLAAQAGAAEGEARVLRGELKRAWAAAQAAEGAGVAAAVGPAVSSLSGTA